ncbi:O-methyltransferase [Agrobacterium leguminum]|uniref:O-methyltransferase n=1 Tax=Agrobacterium leguminum TaxID=2792015 RepID=UPI003CE49CA3
MIAKEAGKLQQAVDAIVTRLIAQGLSVAKDEVEWELYNSFASDIHRSFEIPSTTITPVMRRLLFALGSLTRPRTILSLGSYVGYCPVWLAGKSSTPRQIRVIGVDIDKKSCELFDENFSRLAALDLTSISMCERAEQVVERLGADADVIFIDVDDPVSGKSDYPTLFEVAARKAQPHALIVLHDSAVPKFRDVFDEVRRLSRSIPGAFKADLPIDDCGVLIFQRGTGG